MSDTKLKIAVFIDFDNVEIGVKTTLNLQFDIGAVLEAIKERGEVITKVAYGDWKRSGEHGRAMAQHAVRMVQRVMTPGGDKNGADINLALDALEMAFTHSHINAFVIVGGDSDFITLVEKLKQYDRKVFVVGGRAFTSQVMQKNCTEFIAYENVVPDRPSRQPRQDKGERPRAQQQRHAVDRAGRAAGQARAEGADRSRSLAAARAAEEHAAAARFVVLRARLRRQLVPRVCRQARQGRVWSRSSTRAAARSSSCRAETSSAPPTTASRLRAAPSRCPSVAPADASLDARTARTAGFGCREMPTRVRDALARRRRRAGAPAARRSDHASRAGRCIRGSSSSSCKNAQPDFDERRYGSIADLMRACQKDGSCGSSAIGKARCACSPAAAARARRCRTAGASASATIGAEAAA